MMKYKGLYLNLFAFLLRKPMKQKYGKEMTMDILKKVKPIYKEMLSKTEDIGSDNPMANNIYMGYVFLAIWKAADGKIGSADLREVAAEFIHLPVMQMFMGGRNTNNAKDLKKMKDMFYRMAQWVEEHPEYRGKTWDFNFEETKHRDGIYYHFTRCPLEKFARENGYLEILPVCCDLDYLTCEAVHATLYREQTLAEGGKICDYWIVGDQTRQPE